MKTFIEKKLLLGKKLFLKPKPMGMKKSKLTLFTALLAVLFSITIAGCKKEETHITTTPTCTDGIKNGTETGVDCGGACGACIPPVACFNISTNSTYIGYEVPFTNCSTGGTSYLWHFGDGQTSNEASPSHRYAASGNKVVTLYVINADSTATATTTITVLVNSATYAGNYHVASVCSQSGNSTYDASISPSGSDRIILYNFHNTGESITGDVTGLYVNMSNRAIYGLSINGSAELSADYNVLNATYTVLGGPTDDNCTVACTRY